MLFLEVIFFLTFLAVGCVAVWLWCLQQGHALPGVDWWVWGCGFVALAPLVSLVSLYIGEWARTVVAHVCLVGGFTAVWIGVRFFFGGKNGRIYVSVYAIIVLLLIVIFSWFGLVRPMYEVRLTLSCVFLVVISLSISQRLFYSTLHLRVVLVPGIFYILFAIINALRTIDIILSPAPGSFYLPSYATKALTAATSPVLVAALATLIFLAQSEIRQQTEKSE